MSRNILVIGGSYFAGRVFVETLVPDDSYSLYVVNRGNRPLKIRNVKEIVCDRRNTDMLEHVLPPLMWDAVVDFCAYEPADIDVIFHTLPQNSINHYVLISSTSVYAETSALPIREDSAKLAGRQPELGPFADYGYKKWLTELKLEELCAKPSIPYTVLRPAIIYGKYNYAPRETYFFERIVDGKPIVLPENPLALFQFVSVRDVADIIAQCISNESVFNNAFNLASEDLVSYRRVMDILKDITRDAIATETLSLEEIERRRIPLPYPPDNHLIYSGECITRVLGFRYTPFAEGLRETYRHFVENNPNSGEGIGDRSDHLGGS